MSITHRQIGVLTVILCFAAGSAALAIEVTPSTSVTLQTRVKGIDGDPETSRVHIEATSANAVKLESNTCKEKGLADPLPGSVHTGYSEIDGKRVYYYKIALMARDSVGTCALLFSDGTRTETVNVRVDKR